MSAHVNRPPTTGDVGPRRTAVRGRAVIYLRSSSSDHAEDVHLEQERACRHAAVTLGLEVVTVCREIGAGSLSAHRPGWDRVEELIRAGDVTAVVVSDFTRITCDWDDIPHVMDLHRRHGVDFVTARGQ